MSVPGKQYLVEVTDREPFPFGDKCNCGGKGPGCWLVFHDGKLYKLIHSNNLQKDIWLGEAKRKVGEEEAIKMLRWFCTNCGTVQEP